MALLLTRPGRYALPSSRSPSGEQTSTHPVSVPLQNLAFFASPPCNVLTSQTRTVQSLPPEKTMFGAATFTARQRTVPWWPGSVATRVSVCRSRHAGASRGRRHKGTTSDHHSIYSARVRSPLDNRRFCTLSDTAIVADGQNVVPQKTRLPTHMQYTTLYA